MNEVTISNGKIHKTPKDIQDVLLLKKTIYDFWEHISGLARNEWICWIESAKKNETRERRIRIMLDKFNKGEKRPCCWAGCSHRK